MSAAMKILLVNQVFYPDVVATAQHLTDLAEDLSAAGTQVTVLAARRGYMPPHPVYSAREDYKGIRIIRVWPFSFGRKIRLLRMLDALFVNLAFFLRMLTLPHFDKVVCLTSPPLIGWAAAWMVRLKGGELIYWTMDINPDEAIEAGWIRRGSLKAKLLESALRFTLKRSAWIIALDIYMKKRLVSKGADPEKTAVCPPWAHDICEERVPHDNNPFRLRHGLDGKTVIMYSGNHSICHPLDTLLQAALLLSDEKDLVFLFVGGGERVQDVSLFKEKHNLSNILQLPYVPREELKFSLQAADIHIVVMGDSFVGIVHPCKIYGILSTGRPFIYIGKEASAIGDIVRDEQVGYRAGHHEKDRLIDAVKACQKLTLEQKEALFQRETAAAAKKFSRQILGARVKHIILGKNESGVNA